jgi:peptidyl-prolyl cis-trans isomerase D
MEARVGKRWPELAEQFTNMVYEQSDSLQPGDRQAQARELKTATVQRHPGTREHTGPLASAQVAANPMFGNDAVAQQAQHRRGGGRCRTSLVARPAWCSTARRARCRWPTSRTSVQASVWSPNMGGGAGSARKARRAWPRCRKNNADHAAQHRHRSRAQRPMGGLPRQCAGPGAAAPMGPNCPQVIGVDLEVTQGYMVVRVHQGVAARSLSPGGDAPLHGAVRPEHGRLSEAEAYLSALKTRLQGRGEGSRSRRTAIKARVRCSV